MYILNERKGTVVEHPQIGKLIGGIAYKVTQEQAMIGKHIIGLVVFDTVSEMVK